MPDFIDTSITVTDGSEEINVMATQGEFPSDWELALANAVEEIKAYVDSSVPLKGISPIGFTELSWDTNYTAPSNGYIRGQVTGTADNQFLSVYINDLKVLEHTVMNNRSPVISYPVRRGQRCKVSGPSVITPVTVRFYPD